MPYDSDGEKPHLYRYVANWSSLALIALVILAGIACWFALGPVGGYGTTGDASQVYHAPLEAAAPLPDAPSP